MIYMYKYKDFKQCHEIKLLRERAGGGGKKGRGGGGVVGGVGCWANSRTQNSELRTQNFI